MTRPAADVTRVVNPGTAANTYIYGIGRTGACLLIDPGLDRDAIEQALSTTGHRPQAIYCTHGHFDHVGSAAYFARKFGIDIHLHVADERIARLSNFVLMALKMPQRIEVAASTLPLDEGTLWSSEGTRVDVLHVPGHTPGSVVLLIDGIAFSGDTLYRRAVRPGTLPETDIGQLARSLQRLWVSLPRDTIVQPGHGQAASFGEIQDTNVELRMFLGVDEVGATA